MNCDQIEVWISASQDGELNGRRQRVVEEHLGSCAACRAFAGDLAGLAVSLSAELTYDEAPLALHERVMSQIPEPKPAPIATTVAAVRNPRRWFSFGMVPFGATAAWLFLAGHHTQPPAPLPPSPAPTIQAAVPPLSHEVGPLMTGLPANSTGERESGAAGHSKPPRPSRPTPLNHQIIPPNRTRGEYRPEMEVIRRLRLLRPRRRQYPVARAWRRSHRPLLLARRETPPPLEVPRFETVRPVQVERLVARLRVIDYVLPQAQTPAPQEEPGTEFVLQAARPVQLSQAAWEF